MICYWVELHPAPVPYTPDSRDGLPSGALATCYIHLANFNQTSCLDVSTPEWNLNVKVDVPVQHWLICFYEYAYLICYM